MVHSSSTKYLSSVMPGMDAIHVPNWAEGLSSIAAYSVLAALTLKISTSRCGRIDI
jgi:hypothetical protein